MNSARGEAILSWMEDDNFSVEEDGSASNLEPRFLSLNLNALAKTLEKMDLHEILYIEADILPPEQHTAHSKVSRDEELYHSHTAQATETVTTRVNEPVQQDSSGKIVPIVAEGESSVETESHDQAKDIPILTDQSEKSSAVEADLDHLLNSFGDVHTQPNPVVVASSTSNKNPSVQNSSAFETELDSLLNSHSGTEPFNKPANPSGQKLQTFG